MITYLPPAHKELDIIYNDEYLIALNKPSGLLSVPGRGEDKQDCLVSRVNIEFPEALIAHRLDMSTSGIILFALNKQMLRELNDLFASRKIHKKYIAVVDGLIENEIGEIDQPLICDWPNRPKQIIDYESGKSSQTEYRVIELNKDVNSTRVELSPITGRTHQLRVHMQYLGHAILGDELYGSKEVENRSQRLLLHATSLKLQHPVTNLDLHFESLAPF